VEVRVDETHEVLLGRLERRPPGERGVEHARQRVDVAAVVAVALEPLGGHVGRGADHRPRPGDRGAVDGAGDTEVDEVDEVAVRPRLGDQRVRGLDVAVDQACAVGDVERVGDLVDDAHRPGGRERALPVDEPVEVGAVDQRHVDEQLAVDLAVVVDRHDVGGVQPCREGGLATEPTGVVGVVAHPRRSHPSRDSSPSDPTEPVSTDRRTVRSPTASAARTTVRTATAEQSWFIRETPRDQLKQERQP
jgi:hypothetical protein